MRCGLDDSAVATRITSERFLDTAKKWLQYGREASYPFFWVHVAVISAIAFHAVQWKSIS